ncbi:hypothetical protein [Streptomyces sp. NPDC047097]|uniref:PadR family transcriptional regulator n=1 Tax=Streptomyces sp. NPDC047097 TaxID=3155260 RepID=UPI0033E4D2DE
MTDDGWVAYRVERTAGRPDAKVYQATEEGERVLRARLAEPYEPPVELAARREQLERFRARDRRDEPWLPTVDPARMAVILDHVHHGKEQALLAHVGWLEHILTDLGPAAPADEAQ